MSIEYMQYDKRVVDLNNPPPGYAEYIASLQCCFCGAVDPCDCAFVYIPRPESEPKSKPKQKQKRMVEIKSVCNPHREWIEQQMDSGTSAKDIHRGLIRRFGFKNSYTSVKDFVRKLKGLQHT